MRMEAPTPAAMPMTPKTNGLITPSAAPTSRPAPPADQHARGDGRYAPAHGSKLAPVLSPQLPTFFRPRWRVLRPGRRPVGALLAVLVGFLSHAPASHLPSHQGLPRAPQGLPRASPAPSASRIGTAALLSGASSVVSESSGVSSGSPYRSDGPGVCPFAKGTPLGSATPARRGSVGARITRAPKKSRAPTTVLEPLPARAKRPSEKVAARRMRSAS